jgi:uncharacterized phage protein (TIGR01671 family)
MREILFRAKTIPNCKNVTNGGVIKNPKWIYGYIDLGYMHDCKTALISDEKGNNVYKCQYETIGQYTGLTDKNGNKIFEGDICKHRSNFSGDFIISVVTYTDGCFLAMADNNSGFNLFDKLEVIGNIHDNPELLKGGVG